MTDSRYESSPKEKRFVTRIFCRKFEEKNVFVAAVAPSPTLLGGEGLFVPLLKSAKSARCPFELGELVRVLVEKLGKTN
ncbi:hypothetical protein CEXT_64621 [Caerostris extrusa]|uniref:Ribosomal protein S1 n=1 Tax=Caerostris extrusa TaxID=172846 RepID=A0AAV4MMA8_CAEEX|nr:hypothetical protein CEXT_64621 [Caerostris extrusa]